MLILFFLCSFSCSVEVKYEEVEKENILTIFKKFTWPDLVEGYLLSDRKQEYGSLMLNIFDERTKIIQNHIIQVVCSGADNGSAACEFKAPITTCKITCNGDQGPKVEYKAFGSRSATSDYDISLKAISEGPKGFKSDIEGMMTSIEYIKKLEDILSKYVSGGQILSMSKRFDTNCYPEIMDIYEAHMKTSYSVVMPDFKADLSKLLQNEWTLKDLFGSVAKTMYPDIITYLTAIDSNIVYYGGFWFKLAQEKFDVLKNLDLNSQKQRVSLVTGTLFAEINQIKALSQNKIRSLIGDKIPSSEDEKKKKFYECLEDVGTASQWNAYARIASCHIYATEGYATFGALETVQKKFSVENSLFSCPSLLESSIENMGMLLIHFLEIAFDHSANPETEQSIKIDIDSRAFSDKLKYFMRMMRSFDIEKCNFFNNPEPSLTSGSARWNLLKRSPEIHHYSEQIDFFLRLKKAEEENQDGNTRKIVIGEIYKSQVEKIIQPNSKKDVESLRLVMEWLVAPFFPAFAEGKELIRDRAIWFISRETDLLINYAEKMNIKINVSKGIAQFQQSLSDLADDEPQSKRDQDLSSERESAIESQLRGNSLTIPDTGSKVQHFQSSSVNGKKVEFQNELRNLRALI